MKTRRYKSENGAIYECVVGSKIESNYMDKFELIKEEKVELTHQELQDAMQEAGQLYCAGTIGWKKIFMRELGFGENPAGLEPATSLSQ